MRAIPSSVHPIARRFERRRRALAERRLGAGTSGARRSRLFRTSDGCGDVLSVCAKPCLPEYSNRSGCKLEWRDGGHDGCSPAAMVAPIARTEHLVQRMALSGRVEDTLSGGTAVGVSAPCRSAIPSFPLSVHPIARRLERRRRALAETRLWTGTSRARRPRLFKTSGGCGDVPSIYAKPCLPEYSKRSV